MIGTLKESSLHAKLKTIYNEGTGKIEKQVDKYIIDSVRNELLIEIQTKNFSSIRKKLETLIKNHRVLLVHPIIQDKWITYQDVRNNKISKKRLSPKHGSFLEIFHEMIYISDLISNPNLILEAILIQAEEIRINDGLGSWMRKGWSIDDRKMIKIIDRRLFSNPKHFLNLISPFINSPFTNQNLSNSLGITLKLARKITYSLRRMNILEISEKIGNTYLFSIK